MQNITRWSPDTCECVIEYSWDSEDPQESRVHTADNVVSACPAHSGTPDEHFASVLGENQLKNIVLGKILDHVCDVVDEKESEDGGIVKTLKKGKKYNWSFDEKRNLIITLDGFTEEEKSLVASVVDEHLADSKERLTLA